MAQTPLKRPLKRNLVSNHLPRPQSAHSVLLKSLWRQETCYIYYRPQKGNWVRGLHTHQRSCSSVLLWWRAQETEPSYACISFHQIALLLVPDVFAGKLLILVAQWCTWNLPFYRLMANWVKYSVKGKKKRERTHVCFPKFQHFKSLSSIPFDI